MKRAITLKPPKYISSKLRDPENPPWTEEALGPPLYQRGRGPQKTPTKVATTIRLDQDVLKFFQSKGPGYQTRINDALRSMIKRDLTNRPNRRRSGAG
jgi:uncharacterized protein (DUF4415 family)